VCVYIYMCGEAREKFSLNRFSTNTGGIAVRLERKVDLTMLKWFLMETALGLASCPGCRSQICICGSTKLRREIS